MESASEGRVETAGRDGEGRGSESLSVVSAKKRAKRVWSIIFE